MIKLEKCVPNVYYNQSRDFQFIARLYEILFNSVKLKTDTISSFPYSDTVDSSYVNLIATSLGFKIKHKYSTKQLMSICSILPTILKNKGSISAIELAAKTILKSEGINDKFSYNIDYNTNLITLFISTKLSDVSLLSDVLEYILPAGMCCEIVRTVNLTSLSDGTPTVINPIVDDSANIIVTPSDTPSTLQDLTAASENETENLKADQSYFFNNTVLGAANSLDKVKLSLSIYGKYLTIKSTSYSKATYEIYFDDATEAAGTTQETLIDLSYYISTGKITAGVHKIKVIAYVPGYTGSTQPTASIDQVYIDVLPEKGWLITLDLTSATNDGSENKLYRVLSIDGNTATVVLCADDTITSSISESNNIFENNTADTYLNTNYYNTLSDTAKAALVAQRVTQDQWRYDDTSSKISNAIATYKGTYTAEDATTKQYRIALLDDAYGNKITRNIRLLSAQDIITYLGVKTTSTYTNTPLNSYNLCTMLWNSSSAGGNNIWTLSAESTDSFTTMSVENRNSKLAGNISSSAYIVRPVFMIDLSKIQYTIVNTLGAVSVSSTKTDGIVNWQAVENATSYDIFVDNKFLKSITATSIDLAAESTLDLGEHTVYIVATNPNYMSSKSDSVKATIAQLETPVLTATGTQLSWSLPGNNIESIISIISCYTSTGELERNETTDLETFNTNVWRFLNYSEPHYVSIIFKKDGYRQSEESNRVEIYQLTTPTNLSVSDTTVNWNSVTNATGYYVFVDGTQYQSISAMSNPGINLSGITEIGQHSVQITAYDSNSLYLESQMSETVYVYILPVKGSLISMAVDKTLSGWDEITRTWRVLSISGNNAKVMLCNDSLNGFVFDRSIQYMVGYRYPSSNLDNVLNETWYENYVIKSLKDSGAIIQMTITPDEWAWGEKTASSYTNYTEQNSSGSTWTIARNNSYAPSTIERFVVAPSIDEIIDYCIGDSGRTEITQSEMMTMFYNSEVSSSWITGRAALRTSNSSQNNSAWLYNGVLVSASGGTGYEVDIVPVLTVDLTKIKWTKAS